MPRRPIRVVGAPEGPLRAALRGLRGGPGVPGDFPTEVLAEAERVTGVPRLPALDATDIPFFTLGRSASAGPGHALHLARRPGGFRVRYAVADVAAFVPPGGALDTEAHRRITTLCFPDGTVPLHPAPVAERAASLLPGAVRPAVLWTLDLDADGRSVATDVRRALVRSRARLGHQEAQKEIETGTAEEPVALLKDIGRLRRALEAERGGVSLTVPELDVLEHDHTYRLAYRAPLPVQGWSEQISLLTGTAAAALMLAHGTGALWTLPAAPHGAIGRLRRGAYALRIDWPRHASYARLIRSLDPHLPHHAAFLQECTTLLRGAGCTVFRDGVLPPLTTHAAVAAPYAHCTRPLHRLADRYASEICLAAVANRAPPDWVLEALDALPGETAEGGRRADAVEHACLDTVAAALLQGRVGEVFEGCVVDVQEDEPTLGTVQVEWPPVTAPVESATTPLPLGERLRVRLTRAAPAAAAVRFTPA
ncbi:RNB domain-containing ribonuclease [Streptomyces sp. NPDC007264]|uniref:RNB domain-containing ribonuclease n=1 Tax=Streptomyces sp. NPDC007264 TaxID=3364777 RepID=UPI0036DEB880